MSVKTKVAAISDDVIDLPGSKILEWLSDRKKIPQHWKRSHNNIVSLIASAYELTKYEKKEQQSLSYFDYQKIFKEFESAQGGNSTTLFGSYSNPNTQKWYEVIKAYEKDCYNIGDACQILSQNINYEIPNLKKTIDKSMKALEESSKRETEFNKSKASAITAFKKACTDLGIKGEKIRDEILELPNTLNPLFDEIAQLMKDPIISKAIEFYKEILSQTKSETEKEPLDLLSFVIKHGNITLGQREKVLNPSLHIETDKNDSNNNNNNNSSDDKIEIDWCMDIKNDDVVDQNNTDNPNQPSVIVWEDEADIPAEIQWDDFSMDAIEIVDESSTPLSTSNDNNILSSNNNNNTTKSTINNIDLNETILSDRTLRNQFLDQLFEIEIFLNHRLSEMEKSNSIFGIDQISNESSISVEQCKEYLNRIKTVLSKLFNTRVRQVLEIKSSKKFIDRIVLQFTQKQSSISKYTNLLSELDVKREQLNLTLGESRTKLDQVLKETRSLKSNIEQLLSTQLFDKKKINIMIPFSLN
ncbi:hypothetical protein CYY_007862 [Polysphondylium violaceum]|uniref:Uncharacterized protein n=1 Tax=Polysphondylium violaceum TaxID=133409 RepID=A0A8J4UXE4_9MYCE|nr:hypothetical protein CYY_007862 [Polysphondylium violaceum]